MREYTEISSSNVNLEDVRTRVDRWWRERNRGITSRFDLIKNIRFWIFFGSTIQKKMTTLMVSDSKEGYFYSRLAKGTIELWSAMERNLDPSYTLNVILVGRSMNVAFDRTLLKETCIHHAHECQWKMLRKSLEIDEYI